MTVQNETIVDRVVARLKTQPLGDLITEEDLHDIVTQALPRTFFEERYVKTGSGYSERSERKEPVLFEIMRELLKDAARAAVEKWLIENADLTAEYWKKICDEGLLKYVQGMQNEQATRQLRAALSVVFNEINTDRQRMGLPFLQVPP